MLAFGRDLGVHFEARVHTDASAALGIIQRQGLGKSGTFRHNTYGSKIRSGTTSWTLSRSQDIGDLLTKNVRAELLEKHTRALGVWISDGRASTAPQLSSNVGDPHGGVDDPWKEGTVCVCVCVCVCDPDAPAAAQRAFHSIESEWFASG